MTLRGVALLPIYFSHNRLITLNTQISLLLYVLTTFEQAAEKKNTSSY